MYTLLTQNGEKYNCDTLGQAKRKIFQLKNLLIFDILKNEMINETTTLIVLTDYDKIETYLIEYFPIV